MTDRSMFTLSDVAALLNAELDRPADERAMYDALVGERQLLVEFIKSTVAEDDLPTLERLCIETTPLHMLLTNRSTTVRLRRDVDEPPYDPEEYPVTAACRACAALGAALVAEDPQRFVDIACYWLNRAHIVVPAPSSPPLDVSSAHAERRRHVQATVGSDLSVIVAAWLSELDGAAPVRREGPAVVVLLDSGTSGTKATLRATILGGYPAALLPDPQSMMLFSADERFAEGLQTAWRLAAGAKLPCVAWSITTADGPVDVITDVSLTAAFTVILDEIRRTRGARGLFALRRIRANTAVIGGADADTGALLSVSGYRNKLGAAATLERVVVPAADAERARAQTVESNTEITPADTWKAAARASRRWNRAAVARALGICLVVALAASAAVGIGWQRHNRVQHLRDVSRNLSDQAHQVAADDPVLGYLLAMASDDVARTVGDDTNALGELAQNDARLVRVIRAEHGKFDHASVSPKGGYVLTSSTAGDIALINTATGDTMWKRSYPPGVEMDPTQMRIQSTAFDNGRSVAIATSDNNIEILTRDPDNHWRQTATLAVPASVLHGPLGLNANAPDEVAFTPGGDTLVVYGKRIGLFKYDLQNPSASPRHCAAPPDVEDIATTSSAAVLVQSAQATTINLSDCATSRLIDAPPGAELHAVAIQNDGRPAVIGTRDAEIIALRPGDAEVVLDTRGPYESIATAKTDKGAYVNAHTHGASVGWLTDVGQQLFGFGYGELTLPTTTGALVLRDGSAELYSPDENLAVLNKLTTGGSAITAKWTHDDLVAGGPSKVMVLDGAADWRPSTPVRELPLPGGVDVEEVATTTTAPWRVAAIVRDHVSSARSVVVWDAGTGRVEQMPAVLPPTARHVAFSDDRLFVAFSDKATSGTGEIRAFDYDTAWKQTGEAALAHPPFAIAARDHDDRVFVAVSETDKTPPTLLSLRRSDLGTISESAALAGPVGRSVRLTVLHDGSPVIGFGNGTVMFFDRDLAILDKFSDDALTYVRDLVEVDDLDEILVAGGRKSIALDRRTHAPKAGTWSLGGPYNAFALSPDGRLLAGINVTEAKLTIWQVSKVDLRKQVCSAVRRSLTPEEWQKFVGEDIAYIPAC